MLCKWGGRSASPAMQTKPLPRGISSSTWGKHGVMWFGCLVCWLLGWFVGLATLLLGWLVGTPLMDACMHACMDGWMDPVLPHVPEASGSVSGVSRRSGQSLRSFRKVSKG